MNPASARRIHIVGMPGSGKTTLAWQLAERLDAPYHELDVVGYENGAGARRPLDARRADLAGIIAQPAWITEGGFIWWIEDLLQTADLVVWLDLHWTLCYWRIVTRHIRADLAGNNRHPGFRNMLRFAGGVRPYYTAPAARPPAPDDDNFTRAGTAMVLEPYSEKVIRCRRPAHVAAIRKRLELLAHRC